MDLAPVAVEQIEPQRQRRLRVRHRRRLHDAAEAIGRQHRERQKVVASELGGQVCNGGIGLEVGALDIHMGDAHAVVADDFVARSDDMASGAQLDLRRPVQVWQQIGNIERDTGESRNAARVCHRLFRAHAVERDAAFGDRRGVAVLHPQDDALIRSRCRKPGVTIGGPAHWHRACTTGLRHCRKHRCRAHISRRRGRRHRSRAGKADRRTPTGRTARAPPCYRSRNRPSPGVRGCSHVASSAPSES